MTSSKVGPTRRAIAGDTTDRAQVNTNDHAQVTNKKRERSPSTEPEAEAKEQATNSTVELRERSTEDEDKAEEEQVASNLLLGIFLAACAYERPSKKPRIDDGVTEPTIDKDVDCDMEPLAPSSTPPVLLPTQSTEKQGDIATNSLPTFSFKMPLTAPISGPIFSAPAFPLEPAFGSRPTVFQTSSSGEENLPVLVSVPAPQDPTQPQAPSTPDFPAELALPSQPAVLQTPASGECNTENPRPTPAANPLSSTREPHPMQVSPTIILDHPDVPLDAQLPTSSDKQLIPYSMNSPNVQSESAIGNSATSQYTTPTLLDQDSEMTPQDCDKGTSSHPTKVSPTIVPDHPDVPLDAQLPTSSDKQLIPYSMNSPNVQSESAIGSSATSQYTTPTLLDQDSEMAPQDCDQRTSSHPTEVSPTIVLDHPDVPALDAQPPTSMNSPDVQSESAIGNSTTSQYTTPTLRDQDSEMTPQDCDHGTAPSGASSEHESSNTTLSRDEGTKELVIATLLRMLQIATNEPLLSPTNIPAQSSSNFSLNAPSNTAQPPPPTNPQEHDKAKKTALQAKIRIAAKALLPNPLESVTQEECLKFKHSGSFNDGPTLDDFRPDFRTNRELKTTWNRRLVDVFTEYYLTETDDNDEKEDKAAIELAIWGYIETLRKSFLEDQRMAQLPPDTRNILVKKKKTKAQVCTRRHDVFKRRKKVASFYSEFPNTEMKKHQRLWETISADACSDDEEIKVDDTRQVNEIVEPIWRNPEVSDWFKAFDALHMAWRFRNNTPGRGPFPHIRERTGTRKEIGRVAKGLPMNFYCPTWWAKQSEVLQREINPGPAVDLTFSLPIRQLIQRHQHIRSSTDRPLPEDDPSVPRI